MESYFNGLQKQPAQHLDSQSAENVYDCIFCNKKFKTYASLEEHIKYDMSNCEIMCLQCSMKFLHQRDMDQHIKCVHKKVESIQCPVCTVSFTRSSSLKVHMRGHSGERPFECCVCNKSFLQKCNMERHLKVHTAETKLDTIDCDGTREQKFKVCGSVEGNKLLEAKLNIVKNQTYKVEYNLETETFIPSRFVRKSEKRITLLPWKNIFGAEKIFRSLKPDFGERFHGVLETGMQLRLTANLKKGTDIKAVRSSDFTLPCTWLYLAHSSFFVQHLVSSNVQPLSKFLTKGSSLKQIATVINQHSTNDRKLRLWVHPAEINVIRKMWPFLWRRWDQISVWSYGNEHANYYPKIRTFVVPLSIQIEKLNKTLLRTRDITTLQYRMSVQVHYILECAASFNGLKSRSLTEVQNHINIHSKDSDFAQLLALLFGWSRFEKVNKALELEVGIILNHLHFPVSIDHYTNFIRTKAISYNGEHSVPKVFSVDEVMSNLILLSEYGFVKLSRSKIACNRTVSPAVPETINDILKSYMMDGDQACFTTFKDVIQNLHRAEEMIKYVSKATPFTTKRTKKFFLSKVTVSKPSLHAKHKPLSAQISDKLICSVCNKVFSTSKVLSRHKKIHLKDHSHFCVFCESSFSRKDKLSILILAHIKEKAFACQACEKTFVELRLLKQHDRTHKRVKKFKCTNT